MISPPQTESETQVTVTNACAKAVKPLPTFPLPPDFQNALISRIFSVFWSGFLQRTTRSDLENGF